MPTQRADEIRKRIASLPEREREVVALAAQGKSYQEIAVELGITRQAVGLRMNKAAKALGAESPAELLAPKRRAMSSYGRIPASASARREAEKVARRIATARTRSGLTQEQAAERLIDVLRERAISRGEDPEGVTMSPRTYKRYEHGESLALLQHLDEIAEALGVDKRDLLGQPDRRVDIDVKLDEILAKLEEIHGSLGARQAINGALDDE